MLQLFDDPDLQPAAGKPPLSDLRTLSDGFHQLSLQAMTPPPVPSTPAPVAAARPVIPEPEAPRVYTIGDNGVVPPTVIRQELPPFTGVIERPIVGALEVLIDEQGRVVAASMRGPVLPGYDRQAVQAAQTWRYRPATLNGQPVKFRKFIQVSVTPR